MKRKTIQTLIVALIFSLISFSNLQSQTLLRRISLNEQIANSSLVIEGKVISKKSFWNSDNTLIYTSNIVEVYKIFKGEYVEKVEVITVGGTVGLNALVSSTSLKLRNGDVGVFTLLDANINSNSNEKTTNKQFKTYSSSQGFYKYNLDNDVVVNPFGKKSGIQSSFYKEIMSITKANYIEVSKLSFSSLNKGGTSIAKTNAVIISGFSPTIAQAGTKQILTINGSGFGASQGKVSFSSADDGATSFFEALKTQIISWSDTQITVEIPSEAGTGKIRVTDNSTPSAFNAISSTDLTIEYAESNIEYDPDDVGPLEKRAYSVQHYNQNFLGGYEWTMQTDFFNDTEHSGAKASFERAMESWRCTTKINWKISAFPTSTDVVASDGTNIIRFDNGSELGSGVLGTCYSWYQGCGSYPNLNWFVSGLDIVFDDNATWNFGPGPSSLQYDFESVALHELGHGHQLGHVVDTNNDVMHFNISLGEDQRILGVNNITAANDVQDRSTSVSVCALGVMTNYSGSCALSIDDLELENSITIYPNPAKNQFFIKNESLINLNKVIIYDVSGRLISKVDLTNAQKTVTINLQAASKGLYFVNIYSDNAMITKKLIVK
jgi:hypothetical protein